MERVKKQLLPLLAIVLLLTTAMSVTALAVDPTEEVNTKMVECPVCGGLGICTDCYGQDPDCSVCHGTNDCQECGGSGYVKSPSHFYNSAWSLLPPVVAIVMAVITKEVYSSLFICILVGGMLYANFNFERTMTHVFSDGVVTVLSDPANIGILVFLVILGSIVCLMNKAGGSAAFGRWAQKHIKSRVGAQMATILMGCMVFIDDYFNCLTVGSVMRPITDKYKISRAKLAYLIDATAAPICIIAPISSWVAAVAAFAEDGQGMKLFIHSIPFNYYALLTIVMMVSLTLMKVEFGPMKIHEENAQLNGDLFSGENPYEAAERESKKHESDKGSVVDLLIPVLTLVIFCVIGMIYAGGFFTVGSGTYHNFVQAFTMSDASLGLMLGASAALIAALLYYGFRRVLSFQEMMSCIPDGFKAMVAPMIILTFAWTLRAMTDSLGAKYFVRDFIWNHANSMQVFLPAMVFLIGALVTFATGASWTTFGMLIPIVQSALPASNPLAIVCFSACMAGAVCGDHCSPIADTTIMASAGAQCDHIKHVATQLPYALIVAGVSFLSYIIAGFIPNAWIVLPISILLLLLTLVVIYQIDSRKTIGKTIGKKLPRFVKSK